MVHGTLDALVGYHPHHPEGEPPLFGITAQTFHPWLLLIVPAVGGLLSGWLVFTLAPEAEGHGTDAAIAAYHFRQGQIRPRVPLMKILASALTIGTGGSGGREGPIALIGAGFGSFLGNLLHLRPAERRILMAAGMGAGVAAIFRAPWPAPCSPRRSSTVLRTSKAKSSSPPPCHDHRILHFWPGFRLGSACSTLPPDLKTSQFQNPLELVPYLFLALFMVVLAMLYTRTFYGLTVSVSSSAHAAALQAGPGGVFDRGPGLGPVLSLWPKMNGSCRSCPSATVSFRMP